METGVAIGVLPFENDTADPGQDYLARGLVEDLLVELSRFPTLEVVHGLQDASAIAACGVRYLLRGSVRRMENSIRIYVQLLEAATPRQVWSDRFEASAENLFAVQDEIVRAVASRLAIRVDQARLRQARRKPLANLELYDCWLRGLDCLHRGTMEADAQARAFFERTLSIDPNYARGYAGISLSHFNEWSCQVWELWDDKERLAFENARRAAELDDQDALIQLILGRILLYRREFDMAARHVDRAIALNPNDADVLAHAALCRAYLGDPANGLALANKAIRLNPHHPDWYIGCAALPLFMLRRYAEALELMARTPNATVDLPAYEAAAYAMTGERTRAASSVSKFMADFQERITFGREPEPGEPLRWLQHVNPFRREDDFHHFALGLRAAGLQADPDEGRKAMLSAAAPGASAKGTFRKEGSYWTLGFDGMQLQLSDVKGFHDLAELLAHPHQPIHCLDLAGRSAEPAHADAVMDARARNELAARARTLQEEIDEAERFNDTGRLQTARTELEEIAEALSQAFGLAGKPRRLGGAVEKARTAVTWRIRSAIRKITAAHPSLGKHLEVSVRTGSYCTYAPEKTRTWSF
jgi:TolB-like protein/Tfp pilus assembly protein PilF